MKNTDSDSDASVAGDSAAKTAPTTAYLIARSAGRWSDVYRLKVDALPPKHGVSSSGPPGTAGNDDASSVASGGAGDAVLGRSSSNQIVIRSEKASRRHARVFWDETWRIQDLGSRNGTRVNQQELSPDFATPLSDGDLIEVAGHQILFALRIEQSGMTPPLTVDVEAEDDQAQATDQQITMEITAETVTGRRRRSETLRGSQNSSPPTLAARQGVPLVGDASLLRLAFELGRHETAQERVEATLDCIVERIDPASAGVYVRGESPGADAALPLVATRQSGSRAYRRPPEDLIARQCGRDAEAILARNISGDDSMATENSRGQIDVDSLILAPIRSAGDDIFGVVHLTTHPAQPPLDEASLEYVVTACEILGESLATLTKTQKLGRQLTRTRRQLAQLQEQLAGKVRLIGRSEAIAKISQQISRVAPTKATVLIRGESGTGKELVAAAIHHASDRKDGPLVCLNCAALSPSLLESELFGHEKGAFTGATERKQGKFEAAHTGTLMLDEIGEMESELQAKLLRVLEGHPFERVGGHRPIAANVRVVAATNRDLQAMVAEGTFRQDLYYRLHVVEIVVPPLRKRGNDCLLLADFFLERFNQEMGRKVKGFTEAAKKKLVAYPWPGNIRELRNVIERAVVLGNASVIDADDLMLSPTRSSGNEPNDAMPDESTVEVSLADLEKSHIERVLRYTDNNKSRASAILGIERSTLDRKLKRFAKDA